MSKKDEALKLALEALEWINRVNAMDFEYKRKARESLNAIYEALAEQPAQRCPLCNYQHGHAIGCKNNPVDIALNKMAENARELGLDYEPAQQEPVTYWDLSENEMPVRPRLYDPEEHPNHVPLYTSPPAQQEPVARVAEVHMSRYTIEWTNGPLPEGTELYTSPPAQQEPVARVAEVHMSRYTIEWTNGPLPEGTELYTSPPAQRKPLTINEVEQILAQHNYEIHGDRARYIVRMTEAAHGIKGGA